MVQNRPGYSGNIHLNAITAFGTLSMVDSAECQVVNQMVSVERVLAFKNLEPEAPLTLESDKSLEH